MTQYEKKTFSVKTGSRKPDQCEHGWLDRRGRCVMCGERLAFGIEGRGSVTMAELKNLLAPTRSTP